MNNLILSIPEDATDQQTETFSAIQTWAARQDTNGKWTNVITERPFPIAYYLRVDGTGNSWTGGNGSRYAYTLIGQTMILSFYIISSTLVISAATPFCLLLIPDHYLSAQDAVVSGYMNNAGTSQTAQFSVTVNGPYVTMEKMSAANLSDDSGGAFTVAGQLAFQITT